jgi:hypothetical protein
MADKVTESLLEALKQALSEPGEQRLYRSGKLPGLFPSRAGAAGDAASRALREGFLEVVRTEAKGKLAADWVRLTPAGVRFLHERESPLRALEDLRDALQATRAGVPAWLADVRERLQGVESRVTTEAQRFLHYLEALSQRVEEGLRKLQALAPSIPAGLSDKVPWAGDALAYLDQRQTGNPSVACPLPELFAALVPRFPDLSISDFHQGLRFLHERKAVCLLPCQGLEEPPQPEFAMLEGESVFYFASR